MSSQIGKSIVKCM